MLAGGKDPSAEKKRAKLVEAIGAGNTFKAVAEEYIEKQGREGRAEATLVKARWHLSLLKLLHTRPIADIEPVELLAELRKVESKGYLEAARQARAFASRIFCYVVATKRCKHDVAAPLVKALATPKVTHRAAILDPVKVGGLLRSIDAFDGKITTKLALRLAPHVFVRPGELRHYNTVRPHSSLGYRPPAPETAPSPWLPSGSASLHLRPPMAQEAIMH